LNERTIVYLALYYWASTSISPICA
jgi:hypothetical protein